MRNKKELPKKEAHSQGENSIVPVEIQGNYYIKDGKKYVRVTHVINTVLRKQWLETWRGDVGNLAADTKRDEAAESGNMIHKAIASGDKILPKSLSEDEIEKVIAYWKWYEMAVNETIAIEERVFNERYCYGGRLDARVILKGEKLPTILDVKAGNHDEHYCRLQTAAYFFGDEISAHRRMVVNLKNLTKDGLPRIYSFDRDFGDFHAFLNCLNLYNWLQT